MIERNKHWIGLAGFIAICLLTGALGGWVTSQSVIEWYPTLNKPAWNPPAWVFAPVWTTLYVMMAVAAWLVWKETSARLRCSPALVLFFVQLALNCLWSLLFFGARSPGWALVDIIASARSPCRHHRQCFSIIPGWPAPSCCPISPG